MVRFIPWSSQTKGTFPPPVYISHNLNHLSAYHVTSSRMSLGLRVYSSPLFFDPVSLLMAYQQTAVPKDLIESTIYCYSSLEFEGSFHLPSADIARGFVLCAVVQAFRMRSTSTVCKLWGPHCNVRGLV